MGGDILQIRERYIPEFFAFGRWWNRPALPVDLISKPVVLSASRER
jgi:hypothetical protein